MKRILVLFTGIVTGLLGMAQEFTAGLSDNTVGVGEQFQLTFTINANGSRFQPPPLNDFNVLSGPNQSTSMQFVNGNISQSISYSYILQAKAEGTFKIGPASIESGGKKLQSNPLTIKIVKGSGGGASAGRGGQSAQGNQGGQASTADMGNNLFLRISVNKTTAFQGEELIATYKLYFKVSVVNYGIEKLPSLNGFWTQDIEMPKQPVIHKESIDGVQYNVAEIRKVVLFPQHSGTLELEPMEATTVVRIQAKRKSNPNDIFDQFFNDPFFGGGVQDVSYKVRSNILKINVKELPKAGQTEAFRGAVGKFSMEAFLDKPSTKANDPVTLKIKISGQGNIKLIEAPKLKFPQDIETYDPKTADNISTTVSGVSGSRTFEYLLIPRHQGEYKLDPFAFSYFDPGKNEYVTLRSPEFKLKVEKGNGNESAASTVVGVTKEDVQLLGKDIRFIKPGKTDLRPEGETFYNSAAFYILLVSPFLLLIGFLFFYQQNKELSSNLTLMKSRKANKVALKRLSTAKQFLAQDKKEEFYDAIFKALWGYVSDRLGLPLSQLSKESAASALNKRNVETDLVNQFILTLDNAEFARFAPAGHGEMEVMYKRTVELISKIEEVIK